MVEINWEVEHRRFMDLAYNRTMKAAKRAFWGWHESKIDDSIAECVAKTWDSWSRLLVKGKNPEPMTLRFDPVRRPLGPLRPTHRRQSENARRV